MTGSGGTTSATTGSAGSTSGTANSGGLSSGGTASGGTASGGARSGGSSSGGSASGGAVAMGGAGSGCESEFDDYMAVFGSGFGANTDDASCAGSACDNENPSCQSGNECTYDMEGGTRTMSNITCQAGNPAARCDVVTSDGASLTVSGNMTCQVGASCNIDASDGSFSGLFCQGNSECVLDCSGGTCSNVTAAQSGTTLAIDCEGGDCGGVRCETGATCAIRAAGATAVPICAGGTCLCLSGSASDCADICGGESPAPCANPNGSGLVGSCDFLGVRDCHDPASF